MKTTLSEIKKYNPCASGWKKLLESLGKTQADDDELNLMFILNSNGIKDAIWALRCFEYKEYCLFLADVAESVLHIYEKKHTSKAPREAIEAMRKYQKGLIDKKSLNAAADAAYAAADAAYAAYAAYAAAYAAYAAYARCEKWAEIERLFIVHFGGEK